MLYLALLFVFSNAHVLEFPFSDKKGDPDWMATPVGFRPIKCVHTAKENNHIIHLTDEGSTYEYPRTGETIFYPKLEECVENAKTIEKYLVAKRALSELENAPHSQLLKAHRQERAELGLLHAWDVYGGWYTTPNLMGNFTVEYTLPNEDMPDNGQLLYYFIGAQNNGESDVTIIQPVITYCPSGCNTRTAKVGWSGTSWNCCPSGQSHSGPVIALSKGVSNVFGFAYSDPTAGNVDIYTEYQGKASDLHISGDKRQYDWCDVTLEQYNYATCSSFNDLPFGFYNMTITSTAGNALSNPNWKYVKGVCNGDINCNNNGLDCTIIGDGRT